MYNIYEYCSIRLEIFIFDTGRIIQWYNTSFAPEYSTDYVDIKETGLMHIFEPT